MTASRVAHASLWGMAGASGQYLITFGLLVYLAHVLHPRDFGLMATVTIGLEIGIQIVRLGQVELLQQTRYQHDDARNQALRTSFVIAALLTASFCLLAQPLGRIFESPELTLMFLVCAPIFLIFAAHATADGILRSELQFKKLAYRGSIASVIGGAVAVVLAGSGFGAIALAAQRLVQAVVSVVWVWSAVAWRPTFFRKAPFSRAMLQEGANTMVASMLPTLAPRSIDLFISAFLGPTQLGLYKIAFRIFEFIGQMVVMPLVSVANAQLAQFSSNPAGLRQSYLRFTQVSATMLCPLMVGFAIVAPEAVPILFGPKWISSIPLVQMVSILALTAPPNYFFPPTMFAIGQSRLVIRQGILQIIIGLGMALVAAQYSLTAVLITQIIRGLLLTGYNFYDLRRFTGLRIRDAARCMAPPYVATVVMCAVLITLRFGLFGTLSPFKLLVTLTITGAVTYVGTIILGVKLKLWPDFLSVVQRLMPARLKRFIPF